MEKKVKATIKKYNLIEQGEKIVVGVSGGPDSMCLLDVLNKIQKAPIVQNIQDSAQESPEPVGTFVPKETRNQWDQWDIGGGSYKSYATKRG